MRQILRKVLFILPGLLILLMTAGCGEPTGERDRLSDIEIPGLDSIQLINKELVRIENWQQIVTDSPFSVDCEEINISYAADENGAMREEMLTAYTYGAYPALDGSTVCIPMAAEFARQHLGFNDDIALAVSQFSTTATAYENLINKKGNVNLMDGNSVSFAQLREHAVELILVTQPSDDELHQAQATGVELYIEPICWDAFVFITHKDNPVSSLTLEQIRGIYSGQITNWGELGGLDMDIAAYQREANSGSQTAMEKQVMGGLAMAEPQMSRVKTNMSVLVDAVSEYENNQYSIGYTFKYYVDKLYTDENIKILEIDGIAPTDENIRSREYPLSANYFAVYRSEDLSGTASQFTQWILSDEGQQCIAQAGYIPLG